MDKQILQQRTKKFHVDVINFCSLLPKNVAAYEIAKQLIRAAGSVGANYHATLRAKSKADFIHKIEVVLEEADECHYWLEIIRDAAIVEGKNIDVLIKEANELTAIFAATDKTIKSKYRNVDSINQTS